MLGDGSGVAFTRRSILTAPSPIAIVADDLDLDGDADLVVTHANGEAVSVLVSNGDGTFVAPREVLTEANPGRTTFDLAFTATGDLDGDGYPDLVTTNPGAGTLSLSLTSDPSCAAARTARPPP